jgi:hypothetical protein
MPWAVEKIYKVWVAMRSGNDILEKMACTPPNAVVFRWDWGTRRGQWISAYSVPRRRRPEKRM